MKWEKAQLVKYSDRITKGTTPSSLGFSFTENGINYIKSECITKEGTIDDSKFVYIDEATDNALKRSRIEENDVLISIAGMYLGKTAIAKSKYLPANTNQAVGIIRLKQAEVDPYFVHYQFQDPKVLEYVNRMNGQSAQPNINLKQIGELEFNFPPLHIQQRIASILGAYDDLIANNHRRIQLLEEAAECEYKSMISDSEGWEKLSLYELADIQMGFAFDSKYFNEEGKGKSIIRIRDIPNQWTKSYSTQEADNEFWVKQGDILIGMDGDFHMNEWCGQEGYLVQRVCRIRAHDYLYHSFLRLALLEPIQYYQNTISGSTVAHLGIKHLKEIFIRVPPKELFLRQLKQFNSFAGLKLLLAKQNSYLRQARDTLLPKLMNGEIEI